MDKNEILKNILLELAGEMVRDGELTKADLTKLEQKLNEEA